MTCNASFQSGEIKGHSRHNFRDNVGLVADCGAKEISSHLLTTPKNGKCFHHCMSQSTLKLCLII